MQICRYISIAGIVQFGVFHLPDDKRWPSRWVLICPPFAEELNKTRRLMAEQSRQLAAAGFGVLLLDLDGTGDSPLALYGEGSEAQMSWTHWVQQLCAGLEWLGQNRVTHVQLLGLRLGALLALEILQSTQVDESTHRYPKIEHLVLWQPVTSGKTYMTQFLRLRIAAAMMSNNEAETVSSLRKLAVDDGFAEVAGYRLPRQLIEQLDLKKIESFSLPAALNIDWFDISRTPAKALSPNSSKVIQTWRDTEIEIDIHRIDSDSFWSTQELVSAPQLLLRTSLCFANAQELSDNGLDGSVHARDTDSQFFPHELMGESSFSSLKVLPSECHQNSLVSILHRPSCFNGQAVLIVVGGPQYRVGSHRQFLEISQSLANDGFLVLRFDCRGMGDSEGSFTGFDNIADDIKAAIDSLYSSEKNIKTLSLWGLCDAATAIAIYAASDCRVSQLVMLNPWARSEVGIAKAKLKHYYGKRLLTREFWMKLVSGKLNILDASKGFSENLVRSWRRKNDIDKQIHRANEEISAAPLDKDQPLIAQMAARLKAFKGRTLIILSGRDLTAQEFEQQANSFSPMKTWLDSSSVDINRLDDADHTFSRTQWKQQVEIVTSKWLRNL